MITSNKSTIQHNQNSKFHFVLVFLAAFLPYFCTIYADFVYDDRVAILSNDDVTGKGGILDVFRHDFWGNPINLQGSHKSWRPLITLSFRLQNTIHGLRPEFFHLVNVLIHCFNCFLLTKLANRLFDNSTLATTSACIFAIHPINSEAVCSVVGRADLLSATWVILALLKVGRNDDRKEIYGLAILGIITKETAIILIPMVGIWEILLAQNKKTTKHLKELTLIFAILCYFRLSVNNFESPKFSKSDNPTAHESSIYIRILNFLYLPFFHFSLIVNPSKLSFDWSMNSIPMIQSLKDSRIHAALCFYVILGSCTLFLGSQLLQKNKNTLIPKMTFLLCLLTLPHVISSNLVTYVGFVAAERILYLPTVSYSILLAWLLTFMSEKIFSHSSHYMILSAILTFYALRTCSRVQDWSNEESLFKSALSINPTKAHANLGHVYASRNDFNLAKFHYLSALKLQPSMSDAWYNLGAIEIDPQRSIHAYQNALKYRPAFAAAHLNLALKLWDRNEHILALQHLESCRKSSGENLKNYGNHLKVKATCGYNLGRFLQKLGDFKKAKLIAEEVFKSTPPGFEHESALINLIGTSYAEMDELEKAEYYFSKALENNYLNSYLTMAQLRYRQNRTFEASTLLEQALGLAPTSPAVLQNIAWMAQQQADFNRSFHFYKKALEQKPTHLESLRGLANLLREFGHPSESEEYFAKIVNLTPNSFEAFANLGAILHTNRKYNESLKAYDNALKLNPNDAITLENKKKLLRILQRNRSV